MLMLAAATKLLSKMYVLITIYYQSLATSLHTLQQRKRYKRIKECKKEKQILRKKKETEDKKQTTKLKNRKINENFKIKRKSIREYVLKLIFELKKCAIQTVLVPYSPRI